MTSTRDHVGSVIVVNGASSAGKSTLVSAAQPRMPRPFVAHGLDLYLFTAFLPRDGEGVVRDWPTLRPRVLDGFHRSLRGFADAGVDVLCDVVLESQAQADAMDAALADLDAFWVGLHASPDILRRRELARGDRPVGDAERDLATVHSFHRYDLELDSADGSVVCAERLAVAWQGRDGGR